VRVGDFQVLKPLLLWINDGLMAIFFFTVGLELKREVLEGELSTASRVALPAFAAVGGMVVPAALYAGSTGAMPSRCAAGRYPPQPTSPLRSVC